MNPILYNKNCITYRPTSVIDSFFTEAKTFSINLNGIACSFQPVSQKELVVLGHAIGDQLANVYFEGVPDISRFDILVFDTLTYKIVAVNNMTNRDRATKVLVEKVYNISLSTTWSLLTSNEWGLLTSVQWGLLLS